ncbi:MAG: hypothetical protein ACNS64_12315, partial [Candidatus Halalkalibacterium sp. M3_1C_030]
AISSGATQTYPVDELLKGKGEGLSGQQAKVLGREWIKQIKKNQEYRIPGNSLFDGDYSDLKVEAEDISHYKSHKSKKKQ